MIGKLRIIRYLDRIPLSIRLTLYFVIFGMLIGYITLISFTMLSSGAFLRFTGKIMESEFNSIITGGDADVLLKLAESRDPVLFKAAKTLQTDSIHSISHFKLYYYNASRLAWNEIYLDTAKNQVSYHPIDESHLGKIMRMDKSRVSSHGKFFFGKKDTLHVFVNLTRPVDVNRYYLHIESTRSGLMSLIGNNLVPLLIFEVLLIVMSLILGKIFTRKIVKPITRLSEAAREIAQGDYGQRFSVRTRDELGSLAESLNSMATKTEQHIADIEHRMKTMETMNRIDKAVLSSISRKDLLERVIGFVSGMYEGIDVILALWDRERRGYHLLTPREKNGAVLFHDDPFVPVSAFTDELVSRRETVFQINSRENREILEKNFAIFQGGGNGSILHVPIFLREEYLGSMLVHRETESPFNEEIIGSLTMLADQVGVALQSVQAFDEKEQLLLGIMLALTRSIDAKSRWTAGHSDRVAAYAREIASASGLSGREIGDLGLSALLHDIGKIGVPESVLDKPGRLDPAEMDLIRTHPAKGAEILSQIPSYETIIHGVLHHHEQWGGSGYPHGLGGSDIPVQARVITLADVFEAITDDRPYRQGMTLAEASSFLRDNSGKIFDPGLTDIFLAILNDTDIFTRISGKQS